MFVYYKGTKAQFIKQGFNSENSSYYKKIVFIQGSSSGKFDGEEYTGDCIYTHGVFFSDFGELLNSVPYLRGIGILDKSGIINYYDAAEGGGYVAFGAKDPAEVEITVGNSGINIGLSEEFLSRISSIENTVDGGEY